MSAAPHVLIIGATSAIAEAAARTWAAEGARLFLAARSPEKLALVAADLSTRGASVDCVTLDVMHYHEHARAVEHAFRVLGRVDVVLIAHGDLPDQVQCQTNAGLLLEAMHVNALSVVSLASLAANHLEAQGSGAIVVVGSVAGDRGRKSNYVYGSGKALVETFMEGLAGRLAASGVRVLTIKPGFVDTPMTARYKKGLLWAEPSQIGAIIGARAKSAASGSYYAPRFWWLVMAAIKLLPRRILYRLTI
jgi:decaprenylphospho-beta-D-erythro-pentofuranosid-2-ulose 2-reductase